MHDTVQVDQFAAARCLLAGGVGPDPLARCVDELKQGASKIKSLKLTNHHVASSLYAHPEAEKKCNSHFSVTKEKCKENDYNL